MSEQFMTTQVREIDNESRRIGAALLAWPGPRVEASMPQWRGSQTPGPVVPPVAVLQPKQVDDVVAMVQWARQREIPLSLFSSGAGPHARGMTARQPTVLVDLSQLDRIFHVDERDAIAMIEPGVTYDAFDATLASAGLRAFRPLMPRPNKSVIASILEREPILNANEHWDVLDPFGSVEIVFGTGERFRTGSAARQGTVSEHLQAGLRYLTAIGPGTTDFLRVLQGAQGTLGVVLWAAMMCERIPKVERAFFVPSDDPARLAELLSWVCWRRLGNASFIGNAMHFASLLSNDGAELGALASQMPPWAAWLRIGHGGSEFPQEQFELELEQLEQKAAELGLKVEAALAGQSADALSQRQARCAPDAYQDRCLGAHVSVFCLEQFDGVQTLVDAAQTLLAAQRWPAGQWSAYVQPRVRGRNVHVEFVLPHAPAHVERARRVGQLLAEHLQAQGGFFSRPYGDWAPMAYAKNTGLQPYLRETKALFDPQRILNPGRLCY